MLRNIVSIVLLLGAHFICMNENDRQMERENGCTNKMVVSVGQPNNEYSPKQCIFEGICSMCSSDMYSSTSRRTYTHLHTYCSWADKMANNFECLPSNKSEKTEWTHYTHADRCTCSHTVTHKQANKFNTIQQYAFSKKTIKFIVNNSVNRCVSSSPHSLRCWLVKFRSNWPKDIPMHLEPSWILYVV